MRARLAFLHALRVVAAVLLILGVMPLALTTAASATEPSTGISAKALEDHECDSSEWHFVITQIADSESAPASIHLTWANGSQADVPLDKVTGGTAHYATTANLDSEITSATANIYAGWSGQFNLSHGPCSPPADTEVSAVRPAVTQATCTADYTLTTPSYTVPATEGVDYYVDGNEVTGRVDAAAGSTVIVTAQAKSGYDLTGTSTFTLVFEANPACEEPVDTEVSAVRPTVTQATCTADYTLTTPSYTVPSTAHVAYFVGSDEVVAGTVAAVAGTTTTVTAQAEDGFVLVGTASFTLSFTANPECERPVTPPVQATPVSPVFADSICRTGVAGSSRSATYTIPTTAGVDYYLGEVKLSAGTVNVADGSTVTIVAKAQDGYVLKTAGTFTHTFPTPVCSTGTPTPVTPSDTAVLGVKHTATAATAAGTLPHTGASLPIGRALTGSALLLLTGSLLVAMSRRRPEALDL